MAVFGYFDKYIPTLHFKVKEAIYFQISALLLLQPFASDPGLVAFYAFMIEFVIISLLLIDIHRAEAATGMTKEGYIEAVVQGIQDCKELGIDCDVRLLLSVDRKRDVQDAYDTVKLAESFANKHPGLIVGLDLSGDPTVSLRVIAPINTANFCIFSFYACDVS